MRTLDYRLDIATKNAEKNVDKFNESLEETNKLTELELTLKNADAVSSVKELNEAMEKLQDQALKFDKGSDEFIKAATKAGELKKRMDDVNRSIDTVASGGQLGQLTNSFEQLKMSAMTFDIEGITRNFALMRTQLVSSGAAALGLGQGLNVAAIAARGLAVALAATGITVIIAAIAILISQFDDLADAGGLIGTVFTAIGDSVEFLREKILGLLDDLGLIDLAAQQAAESEAQYFDDLAADLEANGDVYDEYTKKKLQLEIDFYKKTEEIRKNDELSEAQKQQRIKSLTERRARDVLRIEKENAEKVAQAKYEAEKTGIENQIALNEKYIQDRLKVADSEVERSLKMVEKRFAEENAIELEKLNNSKITQDQYNKWLLKKQKEVLDEQTKIYEDRLSVEVESYENAKKAIEDNAALKKKLARDEVSDVKKLLDEKEELERQALRSQLKINIDFINQQEKKEIERINNTYSSSIFSNEEAIKRRGIAEREFAAQRREIETNYEVEKIKIEQKFEAERADKLKTSQKVLSEQLLDIDRDKNVGLNKLDSERLDLQIQLQENITKITELGIKTREYFENESWNRLKGRIDRANQDFENAYLVERARIFQDYSDGLISSQEDLDNKLLLLDTQYVQDKLKKQKQFTDELMVFWKAQVELGVLSQAQFDAMLEASRNKELQLEIELAQKKKQIDDDVTQHKLSNIEKFNENFIAAQDKINAITAMVGQTAAQIGDIMTRVSNRRLQELEENNVAELAAVQARLDAGLITEEEAYNQSLAINDDYNRAKYEQEKKAFEQQKAIQIVNAIIQGIQSVQAAFSSGMAYPFIGPATGAVFAGIAAAFSAAQVALIASEKFPSYGAYSGGAGTQLGSAPSTPSTSGISSAGGGGAGGPQVPASFFTNSGAIIGGEAMLNPGGIYQPPGSNSTQVWVLESDITGSQNQVQVTEDRSYFDAGAFGG